MAEDQYKPADEYQFGESNDSDVYGKDNASKKLIGPGSTAIRRYVLIGIGLIFVVFIVYKLLGAFFTPKQVKNLTATPVAQQPVAPTVSQTAAPTPQSEQPTDTGSLVSQKLQQLEAHNADSKTAVTELNSSVAQLQTSIQTLDSRISDMSNSMNTLTQEVERQKSQLDALKTAKKPAKKPVHHYSAPAKPMVYFINAVIPGRAWLKSSKGTTITVNEGSQIPGYGRVKKIDAYQETVTTSRGTVIKFRNVDN